MHVLVDLFSNQGKHERLRASDRVSESISTISKTPEWRERNIHHGLVEIITIAILAVLSGADGFVARETYGKAKQKWLESFLDLPYGIPSHDTFSRVFAALDPQDLHQSFLSWLDSITDKLSIKLIHIDGKTLRGSYDREEKLKALHSVSAGPSEHSLFHLLSLVIINPLKRGTIGLKLVAVWAVSVTQLPALHRQSQWEGLSTVIMVKSTRQMWNKTTTELTVRSFSN